MASCLLSAASTACTSRPLSSSSRTWFMSESHDSRREALRPNFSASCSNFSCLGREGERERKGGRVGGRGREKERGRKGRREGGRGREMGEEREERAMKWQRPANEDTHRDYLIISLLSATSLSCSAASSLTQAYTWINEVA